MDASRKAWMNSPPFHNEHSDEPSHGMGGTLLYNLVYCSRAVPGTDPHALDRILSTARRRNPQQAITGVLVFGGGVFFQWLEGPRENVSRLMDRIRADPRHQDVVLLSDSEEVRDRLFPQWAMELVTSDDIRDVLVDAQDSSSAQALQALLQQLDAGELGRPAATA